MFNVKIMRMSYKNSNNNFSTPIADLDLMVEMPEVGTPMQFMASNAPGKGILTSKVKEINNYKHALIATTNNSVYEIKLLDGKEEVDSAG